MSFIKKKEINFLFHLNPFSKYDRCDLHDLNQISYCMHALLFNKIVSFMHCYIEMKLFAPYKQLPLKQLFEMRKFFWMIQRLLKNLLYFYMQTEIWLILFAVVRKDLTLRLQFRFFNHRKTPLIKWRYIRLASHI